MRLSRLNFLAAAAISFAAISSAIAATPLGTLTVYYPKNLVDENSKPVDKPILVEIHQVLSPELRIEKIEPLAKKLKEVENDQEKLKIQEEIDRLRTIATTIVSSNMVSAGYSDALKLPYSDYEIHFIPTNLVDRKPVIVRMTLAKPAITVNVQPGPEGGVLGAGPSTAELLVLIQEQQKQIQALNERINQLQKK